MPLKNDLCNDGLDEEVADVVAFLASPRASWVMGENIVIDGGYTKHVKF